MICRLMKFANYSVIGIERLDTLFCVAFDCQNTTAARERLFLALLTLSLL